MLGYNMYYVNEEVSMILLITIAIASLVFLSTALLVGALMLRSRWDKM